MTIERGREWARPVEGTPTVHVRGSDRALAHAAQAAPGSLILFRPDASSDLARAIGLGGEPGQELEVTLDALGIECIGRARSALRGFAALDSGEGWACNMVVVGTPPDRLRPWSRTFTTAITIDGATSRHEHVTTVIVANGQFLRGNDIVPRGHPGDGRAEVQIYAVPRAERPALRRRLPSGGHLPHPRITQRTGESVVLELDRARPVAVDGEAARPAQTVRIDVVPGAFRVVL